VSIGIRPEDIHVKEYVPQGIDTSAVVKARADVIEMMGNELFIYLTAQDFQFLARVDPRAKARAGQEIELVFNLSNMHLFDTTTGKALQNERVVVQSN